MQTWARQMLTVTRKELRSYFGSPMALIFVGAFLAATLFAFFWVDTFFARGVLTCVLSSVDASLEDLLVLR